MNGIDETTTFEHVHVNGQGGAQSSLPVQRDITHSSEYPRPSEQLVPSDKVDISSEAKAKVAEEGSKEKIQNAMQDLATRGREATAAEEGTEVEDIEKMIEELKEQVRELMQQLAKLQAKDDDASLVQQKALEAQIAALNSQIMSLAGMKLEMLEQGKE